MELDGLRRQWQRPEPAGEPVAFDVAGVARLLAQRSVESLEQLRQNARKDLLLNTSFLVVSLVLIFFAPFARLRTMGGLLALIALLCIYYFYRKMGLLRGIARPGEPCALILGALPVGCGPLCASIIGLR